MFLKQFVNSTAAFITQLQQFGDEDEIEIQQFSQVYRTTANLNTSGLMFMRKVKSVFDRQLPEKKNEYKKEDRYS